MIAEASRTSLKSVERGRGKRTFDSNDLAGVDGDTSVDFGEGPLAEHVPKTRNEARERKGWESTETRQGY
jgi:hypothetical protein